MSFSATVGNMWIDGASNSPSKESPSSKGTNHAKSSSGTMNSNTTVASASNDNCNTHALKNRETFRKFYVEHGLENHARKVGLLDSNGDVSAFNHDGRQLAHKNTLLPYDDKKSQTLSPQRSPYKVIMANTPTCVDVTRSPSLILPGSSNQRQMSPVNYMSTSPGTPQTPKSINTPGTSGLKRKNSYDYEMGGDRSDKKRSSSKRTVPTARSGNEKGGKGLRHFSMKVCEKVQQKGTTTYNEVADELVREFSGDPDRGMPGSDQTYDQKNIRRRVYDALNVLMAMNIISKEKKEIKWIGLPTNSAQECETLEKELDVLKDRIQEKKDRLRELIIQQCAYKNLVKRNRQRENENSSTKNSCIQLPFVVINTSKQTVIDCSISNDKFEYLFNFDNAFEIHNDIEILKRMGVVSNDVLNESVDGTEKELDEIKTIIPKSVGDNVSNIFYTGKGSNYNSSTANPSEIPSTSKITPPSSPLAVPIDYHNDSAATMTPEKRRKISSNDKGNTEMEMFQCSSPSISRSSSPYSSTSRSSTPNFSARK